MIVNSKFVFIHLHKSAGTFFNNFIVKFFPDSSQVGYHFPKRMVPQELSHLPVLGLVRNPWDFYVSWYSFQMQKQGSNPLFMVVSKDKTLGFQDTMERLLSLCDDQRLLNKVTQRLPNHFTASGLNVPASVLASIYGTGLGFYGFLYRWMYEGTASLPSIVKKEELVSGLTSFFTEINVLMSDEMLEFLSQQAPLNTSSHRHYASYYDDRIAEKVLGADETIVHNHGYQFEKTVS